MVSVSGIRGIVGESLTPDVVQRYTAAFAASMGRRIVVGRDSRVSGEMVEHLVTGTLLAMGCDVIRIGICPTPTVQLAVENLKASGGIAITASHNPIEWNALKLIGPDGLFLDEQQGRQVVERAEGGDYELATWERLGKVDFYGEAIRDHQAAILKLPFVDLEALRRRKFRVAIDCVNGAGAVFFPEFLQQLGCEVRAINCTPDGRFPHTPEPVPENLTQLSRFIREHPVDVGFAVDPDADRLAILNEKGEPIGEEYTLALAVAFILGKRKGKVVVNASTTRAIDDIAAGFGVPVIRTKVGEIHVAKRMREEQAVIGGEGNGGVILPEVHLGRDAPVAAALTLQHLMESGKRLSELHASLPQYRMVKMKVELGEVSPDEIITKLVEKHSSTEADFTDGVKFLFDRSWVHLRKSNTEPIIRVMAEAPTAEEAHQLARRFRNEITRLME
jgi:phosphomannomutase